MDKNPSKTSAASAATTEKATTTTTLHNTGVSLHNTRVSLHNVRRVLQNFLLIWLDANIDESQEDFKNSLAHLRHIVASITTFTNVQECTDFLREIESEKAFMIVSGSLGQHIVPKIYTWPQLHSIYVFCNNRSVHEQWAKNILKIKGVHTNIESICKALQNDSARCDRALISISFRGIDASFMYTQLIKEALLEINDDEDGDNKSIREFAEYCRLQNDIATDEIESVEREYHQHTPIWWYTAPFFIYSMLNRGLRLLDVDIILKMGFFIRHLHRHIEKLHREQQSKDFEKVKQTKGGLMSFNNFLSTSRDRDLSLNAFARPAALQDSDSVDIRQKILPPTHPDIATSYNNIGLIYSNMGEYTKALSFYEQALHIRQNILPPNHPDLATSYNTVGLVHSNMGDYAKALSFYEQALDICQKMLPPNHPDFAQSYNNIGWVYSNMSEYSKALSCYERALDIRQKILPPNHPDLATSYSNIGKVYSEMGKYSKALASHQRALDIYQKTLPPEHPNFAQSYNNMAMAYQNMGEYGVPKVGIAMFKIL
ncbi:unnamed protein product [Rotaria sp. Silwood1]|nr:unnamed protein product [Rotaria sp. Silwood1]CAF4752496.1 unnamed protein product [Rotaria sp. Silwood1]CAF4843188.1 unnamed protein product [Rotaria sp. Silwood1]